LLEAIIFIIFIILSIVIIKNYTKGILSEYNNSEIDEEENISEDEYKYERIIKIEAIHDEMYAEKMIQELNNINGVFATISFYKNTIDILMEDEIEEEILISIIENYGFNVIKII